MASSSFRNRSIFAFVVATLVLGGASALAQTNQCAATESYVAELLAKNRELLAALAKSEQARTTDRETLQSANDEMRAQLAAKQSTYAGDTTRRERETADLRSRLEQREAAAKALSEAVAARDLEIQKTKEAASAARTELVTAEASKKAIEAKESELRSAREQLRALKSALEAARTERVATPVVAAAPTSNAMSTLALAEEAPLEGSESLCADEEPETESPIDQLATAKARIEGLEKQKDKLEAQAVLTARVVESCKEIESGSKELIEFELAAAKRMYDAKKYAGAMALLEVAAERGVSHAAMSLGVMHLNGIGTRADPVQAMSWFKKGAGGGDPASAAMLAVGYRTALGLPQDYTEAAKWARYAAYQGNSVGEAEYAWLLVRGLGVDQNYPEALHWYRRSISHGNVASVNDLAWILATSPEESFRDPSESLSLASKASATQPNNFAFQQTLAAALARHGEFPKAIAATERARELYRAQAAGTDPEAVQSSIATFEQLIALFQAKQAFTDPQLAMRKPSA